MANSDKNIVITPRIGGTKEPTIVFTGQGNDPITMLITDGVTGSGVTSGAALSIEGSQGQLFSIVNRLGTGSIFSVNDISGIPSINVDADGRVMLAPYSGNIGIGTENPTERMDVSGSIKTSGNVAVNGGSITSTSSTINIMSNITTGNHTVNIANGTFVSGTRNVNIAESVSGGGSQIITIGSQGGKLVSSTSGITLGQATGSSVTNILGTQLNISSSVVSFTGLPSFSGGISASGGITFNSAVSFTGLPSFSGGISASGGITFNAPISSTRLSRITSSSAFETKTASFSPTDADNGKIFVINISGKTSIEVTLDGLSVGWRAYFLCLGGSTTFTSVNGTVKGTYATFAATDSNVQAICYNTNEYHAA